MSIDDMINTIVCGDCLEVMRGLPDGVFDALITDPPYSSGGQFRSDRSQSVAVKYVQTDSVQTCRTDFTGDNRDQRAFLVWCTMWLSEALRLTRPGGICAIFTDWRQLPTMTDAIQCGGWVWRNIVTWWKPGIRMQRGRFSSSAEYLVYGSRGVPTPGEDSPQNVLQCAPVAGSEKEHIAQKPVKLLEDILGVVPAGGLVLDPFCGSGTTLEAARNRGLRYVGIEIDPINCQIARKRIAAEKQGLTVAEMERGQMTLL